ncbi:centromere/kinetochore protein zw10 homolog [Melanaphis sacchari]|uniref:Centromere/kinetochore protein zw10 n=1 Tax=Melanaphis sacchari TaxID=742174 RepID=A0A2H8TXP9_9HEMI|nr:centromere/kinetochore protein zw10 homolog [Melanaphis sacchari]
MSFLAAVLASAGEVEMTDLDKNVSELKHKITNLEYDIKEAMEQRYMKFAVVSRDAASLLDTAQSYSNQINNLISRIDNQTKREVLDAMSDLKMFKSTLEENKNSLIIIEQVLEASMNLTSDSQTKLSLADRIKNLQTAQNILLNNEHLTKLDVYKPLMREHQRLTDVLHSNSVAAWRKKIEWSENDADSQDSWRVILKISGSQEDICDTIFALQHFDSLNIEVKLFADKLINLIVKPIIIQNLQVDVVKFVNVSTMTLKVSNNEDEFMSATIKKLKNVFEFLSSILPADINEIKIMSYLGSYASQQFCKHFKDIVIFNAVPVKYHNLNNFQEDLNEVLEFNKYLSELGFFEESNDELIKYIENIDNLFFTKISQLYYDRARTIIKKDLHDLVEVNNENRWISDEDVLDDNGFCQKIFAYPQSKVSKSLLEFLDLIDTVASDMSSIPENSTWRYHDILNNITIMYCDVIPLQHCKVLEFHPQQSAVLYNNIMYFTRKLAELSPTYKNLLIVHLLEKLKNLASEILHSQCKQQITQIEKIVNQSDIILMAVNSNLGYSVEKSMSQCHDLLSILSGLWRDILPSTVYCKFIGYSCNGLFECLVNKIFTLEDISATSAEQYSSIFNNIIKYIPTLFPEPKEVHRYVPKWWQLNELVYILSSSMKDIENRWADGKGPLANELKVDQIKCLLKALFQNTDRRAALLKHILATAQS